MCSPMIRYVGNVPDPPWIDLLNKAQGQIIVLAPLESQPETTDLAYEFESCRPQDDG